MFTNSNLNSVPSSDVQLQNTSDKVFRQSLPRAPIQGFPSFTRNESHSHWQGSLQRPDGQLLGGIGRGICLPENFQQHKQFRHSQQEPHEENWQFVGPQHRGQLEQQRLRNMRQEAQIALPETSYSALLHGPDTPPSQAQPAWGRPGVELENPAAAAARSSLQVKDVRGDQVHPNELLARRDQGSLHQYGVESAVIFQPGIKENFPERFKGEDEKKSETCLEVPSPQTLHLEHSIERKQTWPAHFTGYRTQHFGEGKQVPHSFSGIHDKKWTQRRDFAVSTHEWDGQKHPSDAISASLQRISLDPCHNQPQYGKPGEISHYQQESGHASSDMHLQQHNSWNAPQARMINTRFIIQPQPHADANYTDWGVSAWQQGHHFSEDTPSYAPDTFHMGPSHAEYGWYMGPTALPHPASAMASSFAPFNAEGFYPPATGIAREGAGFGSIPETETAYPPALESHSCYSGPPVNYISVNSCIGGSGMPINGIGHNGNWNSFIEQQDFARQKKFGPIVHAGGETGQTHSHSNAGQHVVNSMQGEQRESPKLPSDNVIDMEGSRNDLEGPKLKKQRDFPGVNDHPYNLRPGQPDVCINLQGDVTFPRKNIHHVQSVRSSFVGSEKGHSIQPTFENSCSEIALSHEICSSEAINGVMPPSAMPPNLACSPIEAGMQRPVQSLPESILPFEAEQMQGPLNDNCHKCEQANDTRLQEKSVNPGVTQSGGRAHVLQSTAFSRFMDTGKTFYHTRMPLHGFQGFAPEAYPDNQHSTVSPWNDFEGPNSMSMSSLTNQDSQGMHNAIASGPGGSLFCTPLGQPIGARPQLQGQRATRSQSLVKNVHLNSMRVPVHSQEVNQFSVSPDSGSQLGGFSSAMGKYYPRPPFQSPPMHPYTGSMEKGRYHHSAGGGLGKSISVSETGTELQPLCFPEAGNMSSQSAADNVFHVQSLNPGIQKDVVRCIPSGPKIVELQESANVSSRPSENEHLTPSQVSGYHNHLASDKALANITQVSGDQNNSEFHIGHQNSGVECATFRGQEQTSSPKVVGGKLSPHQFMSPKADLHAPIALQPKKRKKPLSFLIPWHIAATQPRVQLPLISKAEVIWANAANRVPEKDGGEVLDEGFSKAQKRLRVTTQLMQQLISPLPSVLMHSDKPMEYEHGIYYLTRFALGEACRLMAGFERESEPAVKCMDIKSTGIQGQTRMPTRMKEVAMTKLVERFVERVKRLDIELARFECSMSALDLRSKSHDLENLSLVNRLGKHYGRALSLDSDSKPMAESRSAPPAAAGGIRRLPPQKYVIPVPMSRTTLPEGVRCLSL